jgi:two-component system, OmpR family, sensor kinase
MRTLRGRIGVALLAFALTTLATLGGGLWVVLRDLHRDAETAALTDLLVPYVTQARQRLLPAPPVRSQRWSGGSWSDGAADAARPGAAARLIETRRFMLAAQEEIAASGVSLLLAREDGALIIISPEGAVSGDALDPDVTIPASRGEVARGTLDLAGVGPSLYAATRISTGRLDGGVAALVLARRDDSAALATADLVRALGVGALILLVVGAPLAAWLGRSVSRPLDRLALASEAVARGHLPEPLPEEGPAEVARASAAFNTMASEVAASREAQRQLLADVRHDLRTPLTVISGFAEALRDGTATGPAAARAADVIADEAGRLGRMLADLGDLADLEPGAHPLRPEVLDAGALVREAAERFEPQAAARGQRIDPVSAAAGAWVVADRGAIERILANLVHNALAHARSPGGRIGLEVRPVAPGDPPVGGPGGWQGRPGVMLAVRDDGPGIPRGALHRVFDRFYRADPARSGPGSGLGLAIVASLAHTMAGRAFAENPSDGGARVGVVLPAAPAPMGASPASASATARGAASRASA